MDLNADKFSGPSSYKVLEKGCHRNGVCTNYHLPKFIPSRMVSIDQKVANLTPLFQKGRREKMGNCKPVNVTSAVSGILGTIIKCIVAKHSETNNSIQS